VECPLYPRKLPRLLPTGAAVIGHKQTSDRIANIG
jgi:hypothetical protein